MKNILDEIVLHKRQEVSSQKNTLPEEELRDRITGMARCRNFHRAVTKENSRGLNVIAEVKKASPSAGVIRTDFDPVAIAKTYEKCGADAISVLTDEKYFQGRLEYIPLIKEAVGVPVLRKDFLIDKYQVYESRAAGADAVLLIAEALKPGELIDLLILANELTMTALIEVHDADSLLAIRSVIGFPQRHYSVLGINNRDLSSMKVDFNTAVRLSELVENHRELIVESGIRTRQNVEKIISLGLGGVLIGQALCQSPDIEAKFTELFGPGR